MNGRPCLGSARRAELWRPKAEHVATARVLELARRLGPDDYQSLLVLSKDRPDAYWDAAIEFLDFRWRRRPDRYVDLRRGPEFPRWFPGGRLNWVDTVLAVAEDPGTASSLALVDEAEDGSVRRLTFAELGIAVRCFATGLRHRGVGRGDRIGLLSDNGIEATISHPSGLFGREARRPFLPR